MNEKQRLLLELQRIEAKEPTKLISNPRDAFSILAKYRKKKQEEFFVICLDAGHRVLLCKSVSKGTVNRTIVHPREVFRVAIRKNSVAVIVAHNHPSGNIDPSMEDREVTKKIVEAGKILEIPVLDHIIVGDGFFSFSEEGLL